MALPTKLDPCPIYEALVEIRFQSNLFPDAIFGSIYNSLKKDFPTAKKLPIAQIPDEIRKTNPDLRYKPHYQLLGKDEFLIIQVGPDVLTINNPHQYMGWSNFRPFINSVWQQVISTKVISTIDQLAVRYINFFHVNIFENIKAKLILVNDELGKEETFLKSSIKNPPFFSNLHVTNKAIVTKQKSQTENGSVIDIETVCPGSEIKTPDSVPEQIEKARLIAKTLFFSLLDPDFLKTFNPE